MQAQGPNRQLTRQGNCPVRLPKQSLGGPIKNRRHDSSLRCHAQAQVLYRERITLPSSLACSQGRGRAHPIASRMFSCPPPVSISRPLLRTVDTSRMKPAIWAIAQRHSEMRRRRQKAVDNAVENPALLNLKRRVVSGLPCISCFVGCSRSYARPLSFDTRLPSIGTFCFRFLPALSSTTNMQAGERSSGVPFNGPKAT